jgi:hypothetical protein
VGCNNDHRAIRGAAMATLDYGTRINDLPHIREYRVRSNVFAGSGLDRPQLLGTSTGRAESLDLGMVRFKLYSIEVDEVTHVIALVRIRPRALQFDPGYYQYGGAYLYPLGAWYLLLPKFGVITVGPLDQMLRLSGRICLLRFKVGLPTTRFWKDDYNMVRPHSGLGNLAAPIFARNGATGTQQGCAMLCARPALLLRRANKAQIKRETLLIAG